jgi:hypothetical protein
MVTDSTEAGDWVAVVGATGVAPAWLTCTDCEGELQVTET